VFSAPIFRGPQPQDCPRSLLFPVPASFSLANIVKLHKCI
jgi:hypothetical protein